MGHPVIDRHANLERLLYADSLTPIATDGEVQTGTRNNRLTSEAGRLRRAGQSEAAIGAALRVVNQERCSPPLEDREVAEIARSVARYPAGQTAHPLTEAGSAEAFSLECGDRVRYDFRRQRWLLWQGHRWAPDTDGGIMRLALAFVRHQQHAAIDITDTAERQRAVDHWIKFDRLANLNTLLTLARNLTPIRDDGRNWDPNPMLLGTPDSVVDLTTCTAREGQPSDRITRSTSVPYNPAATCPRWERFVSEVFNDSPALVGFIHRALGYTITGLTGEQVLFLGHGTGSNGKGVLMRTVGRVMGDYFAVMPFSTIELNQRASIPNDLAALDGPRYVMSSETNDGSRINEARVKALTGCDPLTARFLHSEFFTFNPVAKFWLAVNHLPIVRDDSHSFWRRIRQVPFARTFPITRGFEEGLWEEAPGILAWLVRGCQLWQAEGLLVPEVVLSATNEYRAASDLLADFLNEACELEPSAEVGAADLYQHYSQWATKAGMTDRERLNATRFGAKVAERFQRRHSRSGKVYQGVARRGL